MAYFSSCIFITILILKVVSLKIDLFSFVFLSSYKVDGPSNDDRSLFFDQLIEASLSVLSETTFSKLQTSTSVPELPKAPKVVSGPKISELKAKVEEEQHALRRMRMCLRDVCNR